MFFQGAPQHYMQVFIIVDRNIAIKNDYRQLFLTDK